MAWQLTHSLPPKLRDGLRRIGRTQFCPLTRVGSLPLDPGALLLGKQLGLAA
jgi:hypothetical protein